MHAPSRSILASVALLSAFVSGQATAPALSNGSQAPVVDLGYVKYLGYTNDTAGIAYYRGIQYAQPPTGAMRWQKPLPIEAANDFHGQTINATKLAPACHQSVPKSIYSVPGPGSFGVRCGIGLVRMQVLY